jgi:hypothetical protein
MAPYLLSVRRKYGSTSTYLTRHAGAFGVIGVIALSTFLIGWWVTVIVAYLLDVKVSTAMKGAGVGLLTGAFVFWASYEGLMQWVPNPMIVTAITLVSSFGLAKIIAYKIGKSNNSIAGKENIHPHSE